jgi:hypothetical protein
MIDALWFAVTVNLVLQISTSVDRTPAIRAAGIAFKKIRRIGVKAVLGQAFIVPGL